MEDVQFSRGPRGEARFDYAADGERKTLLIEPIKEGILETLFDEEGGILKQIAIKGGAQTMESEVEGLLKRLVSVGNTTYREVMLKKKCPHCGETGLVRAKDQSAGVSDVPIIPTYVCSSCGGKSYHLTDAHLKSLVSDSKTLFSDTELRELNNSEEEFLKELKEYIIRIFASKRIIAIK